VGGTRRPPAGTPAVVVIQKVSAVELEHRSALDFPLSERVSTLGASLVFHCSWAAIKKGKP
jgi:hypothetical protein